jgi:hypothetical protein
MPLSPASGNGRSICLGFQWDAASWETVSALWHPLFSWLGSRTVHWNLPALPADMAPRRRASVLKPLAARIESQADGVTAMGFSGAAHPLLTIDELEREVTWGLKNPWGTGITDVLGVRPLLLVPRVADLRRADSWKVYGHNGFGLIGIFRDEGTRVSEVPAGCLSFVRAGLAGNRPDAEDARRVGRLASSPSGTLLQVDLSGVTDGGALRSLLEGPSGIFGARMPALQPLPEPPGPLPAAAPARQGKQDWRPFCLAGLHETLEDTGSLSRKKRKKNDEYGALLSRMGSAGDGRPAAQDAGKLQKNLRLVAHMLGEVALAGNGFDVRLQGGRFCGITRQGKQMLPALPALSYLRVGSKTSWYRTVSSFSFESDRGTGLREELRIPGTDGPSVGIEYSFQDDSPLLSIVLDTIFPDVAAGAQVQEHAPLALALRLLKKGESATIEFSAPDGSGSSVDVSEETGSVIVPGALHRIRRTDGGWILLRYSHPGISAWGLPSFRVRRIGRARVLEANPFGSYDRQPGHTLGGRHASFSLRIGLEDA